MQTYINNFAFYASLIEIMTTTVRYIVELSFYAHKKNNYYSLNLHKDSVFACILKTDCEKMICQHGTSTHEND